jgi:hypothetical protein
MSVVLRVSTEEHLREIKDSKARREIHVDQLAVVENWDGPSTDLFKTNGKLTQHFTRRLEDDDGLVAIARKLYRTKRGPTCEPPSALLLMEPHNEETLKRLSALIGRVRQVDLTEAEAGPFYIMPPVGGNDRWHITYDNRSRYRQHLITDFFASDHNATKNPGGRPKKQKVA